MFDDCIIFNSNEGELLVGLGIESKFEWMNSDDFEHLDHYLKMNNDRFVAGMIGYDFKNEIEKLDSNNFDGIGFPELVFWVPNVVAEVSENTITLVKGYYSHAYRKQLETIQKTYFSDEPIEIDSIALKSRTSKAAYIKNVSSLKNHIQQGNIYEINYCQEFYAEDVALKGFDTYRKVNQLTAAPFSVYFSLGQFEGICSSPERFLKKTGHQLLSQPIKGTIARGANDEADEELKNQLRNDPKELSENVMIVDLVRNDLSKIAVKNTVEVDELFGIYTFNTVHQMISTVSCEITNETRFSDILKATFPMGSMTGAPKISAMKLSEEHEDFKRGLYAGSIGLITPGGDFDFNVVIRSILYNSENRYLSCAVGGAITIESDPEREYAECETKIGAIKDLLGGK